MKKAFALMLALVMVLGVLAGCTSKKEEPKSEATAPATAAEKTAPAAEKTTALTPVVPMSSPR